MKRKAIIVITTRDYPCPPNDSFVYLDLPRIETVMKEKIDLKEQGNIDRLGPHITDESEIDEFQDFARRILVWEHSSASWCKNSDYFQNTVLVEGLKLARITLEGNKDNEYIIYVGPCTNGQDKLQFRREYSAAMLLTALKDCGGVKEGDSIIMVAHDKDVVDEDGCGPVSTSVFEKCDVASEISPLHQLQVLKFQHENTDKIWDAIIKPIRDKTITTDTCDAFIDLVNSFREQHVEFSSFFKEDIVTKSYLKKVEINQLYTHYPDLFPPFKK